MTSGWDAVFEYEGETYAEMDKTAKVCDSSLANPFPHLPAGTRLCRSSFIFPSTLSVIHRLVWTFLTSRSSLTDVFQQNQISHRGKALTKLKAWLAGSDQEH